MDEEEQLKQFHKRLQPLNKHGHADTASWQWLNLLRNNTTDNDGQLITIDFMVSKFNSYLNHWNTLYSKKAKDGFLSKENALMDLTQFIVSKSYLKTFELPLDSRDYYLFGGKSVDELRKQLQQFKEELK